MTSPGQGIIRRARHARGLTLAQVAAKAGVGETAVSTAELRSNPSIGVLHKYGQAMGLQLVIYYLDPEGEPIE